jgi:hypothetical protein
MAAGAPNSAGTRDVRVLRITDQTAPLAEVASVENPPANPPTIARMDVGQPAGGQGLAAQAQIDTTETARLAPWELVKRAKPSAF